jgi:hypothetical protein
VGIFDEIVVVVDTGGADRTVEKGRLLGAKAAKIARTTTLQSTLPSCHLRGEERKRSATFVARNARFTCYRRGAATILSVVRSGRNVVGDLAALIKTKSVPSDTGCRPYLIEAIGDRRWTPSKKRQKAPISATRGQVREACPALAKIRAIECCYDRLSVGDYVSVDDYGNVAGCPLAVHDIRAVRAIYDPNQPIAWAGLCRNDTSDDIGPQRPSPRRCRW